MFKKPIVTTDFTGAKEQIKDGKTGLIVNINEMEIYESVKRLINNRDLQKQFSKNLSKENFDNSLEIKKIII